MNKKTSIIILLFTLCIVFKLIAVSYTIVSIDSGNFIEATPYTSELQGRYGLVAGTFASMTPHVFVITYATFTYALALKIIQSELSLTLVFAYVTILLSLYIVINGYDAVHDVLMWHTQGAINI